MLSPLPPTDWPGTLDDMRGGFAARLNVYGLMAHHPDLLRAWSGFRHHVVLANSLGEAFSEVVILRTGVRLGSDYEWCHHIVRGRAAGLSDDRISSLRGAPEAMDKVDRILCRAVDELFDDRALSADSQQALIDLVGVSGMLDVMATVAHYSMLGFMLNSFRADLDADVTEALARTPLGARG